MAEPSRHLPLKLIAGFITNKSRQFTLARRILENKFGTADKETDFLDFSCTSYYEKELGKNLKRKFLSFEKLIMPNKNYRIKLYTNRIERKLSENRARTINIDPGYISLTKLVLFTTKNRSHRIYIDRGIFADLELGFANKSFRAHEWTYPDYRTKEYTDFFNSVRAVYLTQIKGHI